MTNCNWHIIAKNLTTYHLPVALITNLLADSLADSLKDSLTYSLVTDPSEEFSSSALRHRSELQWIHSFQIFAHNRSLWWIRNRRNAQVAHRMAAFSFSKTSLTREVCAFFSHFRVTKTERIEAAHYFKIVPTKHGIFENYGDTPNNYGVAAFKLDIMCQITLQHNLCHTNFNFLISKSQILLNFDLTPFCQVSGYISGFIGSIAWKNPKKCDF